MAKRDSEYSATFEMNEDGAREVSEQIMDSYNSGIIDQESPQASNVEMDEKNR
ncbi:hypothetical protein [Bacillus sp. MRMR6]|uniref:hypothetical protein n=1 Tax=Bacillus sp. MRMR6 TaxID=1928617 RepID=UPI00158E2D47|nr:hypothetical protein [Bacillus sp. MRMR6]